MPNIDDIMKPRANHISPNQTPSLATMAGNLIGAVRAASNHAIQTGVIFASKEIAIKRMKICVGCEFFQKDSARCIRCGCMMKAKVSLETSKCPINKW